MPKETIDLKKDEFRAIKQGGMLMSDNLNKFTQLACYAPKDVATNKARQSRFLKGLNSGLQVGLITYNFSNFQELVNKTHILDDKHKELEDNRKSRMSQ